ncbi:ABC transporter [Brevibacterium sp. Mu109]|nr:ABC transporter [Brevibacterium sp. Mu109]
MLDGASAVPERRGVDHLRWIAQSNRIPAQRIGEVLETVGLTDAATVRVRKYSLGMKQRLGLAAALLGEPRILVLDEPVNGLDPEGIRTIRTFLRRYADQGNTVLLSSHLMGETAETVDDIVIINKGRIIADGTLDEITEGHASLEDAFFALTGSEPGQSW